MKMKKQTDQETEDLFARTFEIFQKVDRLFEARFERIQKLQLEKMKSIVTLNDVNIQISHKMNNMMIYTKYQNKFFKTNSEIAKFCEKSDLKAAKEH